MLILAVGARQAQIMKLAAVFVVCVAALGEAIPVELDTKTSSDVAATKEGKKMTKSFTQPQNAKGGSDFPVR